MKCDNIHNQLSNFIAVKISNQLLFSAKSPFSTPELIHSSLLPSISLSLSHTSTHSAVMTV